VEARIRRRVEEDLRNHAKYRLELKELLEETATEGKGELDGQPKQKGLTGDPTAASVIRYYSKARVRFLTHICDTIDRCLYQLDKDPEIQYCKQRMVSMLYFRTGHTVQSVVDELSYSRAHVYRWKKEVTEQIAKELGYLV